MPIRIGLLLVIVAPSVLADTLRCSGGVVDTDDLKYTVRAKCGEPASLERYSAPEFGAAYWWERRKSELDPADIGIREVWVYDFGPNKLGARLTFINGQLTQIETLGYGR
ncbi:DUF2845 domain-containing protein [Andreprevotia chitinilytica]|uniref:DUF2845 domain-containing protein n=1 Tax=Andreprevotia chitinilytica TaxID=396808 RepID=UPI000554AD58|nr:DUF2845 domain-containing protein [Andreprevotia chitinilytica]